MLHRLLVILLCYALACGQAFASQNALLSPTTGTVSGVQLTNNYNNALDSVNTCNSGSSAPTNQLSGVPSLGNCWLNTSTGAVQFYDGTSWLTVGYLDATNHIFTPIVGGNVATNVTSGSTTNLCGSAGAAPTGAYLTITGTATITSFGSNCAVGQVKILNFASTATLTYNATSLIVPGAANITAAANDIAVAIYLGGSDWQVVIYQRASGTAVSSSLNFTGALFVNSAISPSSLSTSQNDYNPSGLSTANIIRQASSAAVNITGLTAPATNGQRITIQNVNAAGGFVITLTASDANSTAANRFLLPHPIGLQPLQSVTVVYDAISSRWRLEQKIYASPYQSGFKNLRVFNVATYLGDTAPSTPNSQLKIAADEVVLEDGTGNSVRAAVTSPCTIDFTTNGAAGLDTGSLSTGNWYFVYVIFNPSTNATSCMGSLSATGGTLPSGYTFWARVGANYYLTANSVTGFQRVVQYGRHAFYILKSSSPTALLPLLSSTNGEGSITAPTWVAKPVTPVVPATASQIDLVLMISAAALAILAPNNNYGAYNSATNPPPVNLLAASGGQEVSTRVTFQLESSNVYTANNGSGGSFALLVAGWEDNL